MPISDDGLLFALVLSYYGLIGDSIQERPKICCPFHDDPKPSMQAFLDTGRYKCYGCGVTGNMLQFVMQMESCNELKALMLIEKIKKGNVKANKIKIRVDKPLSGRESIKEARVYFYSLPKTKWENAPKTSYLLDRGYTPDTLNRLDFRENYNHIYGVIAPMLDMGRFKGYVCRATLSQFNDRIIDRKYLYNKGFSRYNTLVGNYNKPWVVITEGFLDYAKLIQFGIDNSAAILGWKATDIQIEKVLKYTDKVISALDNTPTGKDGTLYLAQFFTVVRFQFPGHRKDLGDMEEYEFNVAWKRTMDKIKKKEYVKCKQVKGKQ